MRGWLWWRRIALPAVLPYYVTGAITASGGSWNASIVAEVASWGNEHLEANGLGAYIAQQTDAGDFHRIVLGIAVMSLFVVVINRVFWRPLYSTPNANSGWAEADERMTRAPLSSIFTVCARPFRSADGGELLVLDGIELQLAQGQIVGLLGRTGSGKSTLLRLDRRPGAAVRRHRHLSRPAGDWRRRPASPWCSRPSRCFPG